MTRKGGKKKWQIQWCSYCDFLLQCACQGQLVCNGCCVHVRIVMA
jgi:hypothetical protein